MSFAQDTKDKLLALIHEMSLHVGDYAVCHSAFTRRRKLDFEIMMHFILSMETGNLSDELNKYFDFDTDAATRSAFIQQRSKISDNAFPTLLKNFNNLYPYALLNSQYQLLAVDGSSFTYTRNPADVESYFPPDGKTTNGYNQIHIIPSYDVLSRRYLDAVIQPIRQKNEFAAMCTLIDRHTSANGVTPLFIADRGFHSYNVFAHAIEHHAKFIIRATDLKLKRLLGDDIFNQDTYDVTVTRILTRSYSKKKQQHPEMADQYRVICKGVAFDYITEENPEYMISLRIIRFKLSDDNYENIVTNLSEEEFSVDDIKALYNLRWGIETSFRDLKHTIGAVNFHSKNRKYIAMEIWARLLLYNFSSIITGHIVLNKKQRKYRYQVNFSEAIKLCHYLLQVHKGEDLPDIEGLIGKNILPVRPGRKYARQHRFRVPISFTYRFA